MSKENMKSIKAGIVGLGRAGWHLHLEPMLALPEFSIVAVADPEKERTMRAQGVANCQAFSSLDELLAGSDAELVVIATPSHHHYADAAKVLGSGRHCLLEKPMCLSFAEARQLVDLARRTGKHLFVHHILVHGAEFRCLREIVESGKLGPLFHIRRFRGGYKRRSDWQTLRRNGGGMLNNHGSHMLSTLLPLLGSRVEEVSATLENIKDAGDAEDHAHLILRTEAGVTADLVISSAIAHSLPSWLICGRQGSLVMDGNTARLKYYDDSALHLPDAAEGLVASEGSLLADELPWQEEEIAIDPAQRVSFHENVRDVLRFGASPLVTAESALEVVRVTEMAFLSAGVRSRESEKAVLVS